MVHHKIIKPNNYDPFSMGTVAKEKWQDEAVGWRERLKGSVGPSSQPQPPPNYSRDGRWHGPWHRGEFLHHWEGCVPRAGNSVCGAQPPSCLGSPSSSRSAHLSPGLPRLSHQGCRLPGGSFQSPCPACLPLFTLLPSFLLLPVLPHFCSHFICPSSSWPSPFLPLSSSWFSICSPPTSFLLSGYDSGEAGGTVLRD